MLNPLNFLSKIIKSSNQKELDKLKKNAKKINDLEEEVIKLDDQSFPQKTKELIDQVKNGTSLEKILPEAFALAREASKRTTNERHFDVQIIGGIVLHENKIAEMKTGEGKTLTIALAAYLNALSKKGVHIVTVNDYLAKRDCENMKGIYNFLGLTSGYINNDQSDVFAGRKKFYKHLDDNKATSDGFRISQKEDSTLVSHSYIIDRNESGGKIRGEEEITVALYQSKDLFNYYTDPEIVGYIQKLIFPQSHIIISTVFP